MPRVITRAEWKARPPKSTPTKVPLSARTASCVHHDGSEPITVTTFEQACALARKDQNYHMGPARGWNDIGYNFLVISAPGFPDVDGLIMEGRGRDVLGAHCLNHNNEWIGIQVATGGDQVPSPAALASVRWLHDSFEAAGHRALGKKVHSDGFNTACPGPILKTWVHSGMPVAHVAPVAPSRGPVRPPITKPAPPRYPLPVTHWFGVASRDPRNHSGYAVIDRPAIKAIQVKVHVTPSGRFDLNTRAHVIAAQKAAGIAVDGTVGPQTWNVLNR